MLNYHLDTDFGGDPDDFAALLMLLGMPEIRLTGITTVLDEAGHRAGAVRQVLDVLGKADVPLAAGARIGLTTPTRAGIRKDFWRDVLPVPAQYPGESLELIERGLAKFSVLGLIGPYTNIAMLRQILGTSLRGFRVVHMGGFITKAAAGFPQWTAADDFNIQFDTRAVELLYASAADITMVPMPIAMQAWITQSDVARIDASGRLGNLLAYQLRTWSSDQHWSKVGRSNEGLPNDLAGIMWDPVTALIATGWDGAQIEQTKLRLVNQDDIIHFERDDATGRPVDVVTSIDTSAFRETFLTAIETAQSLTGD